MQVIREVLNRDNLRTIEVPKEFGEQFEVIIMPLKNEKNRINSTINENQTLMEYQQNNGFSQKILASKEEDVWNDL